MNRHTLTDHDIESMLKDAGTTFAPTESFKADLRERLVPASARKPERALSGSRLTLADAWRYLAQPRRRAWGLASLAAACVAIIATALLWPTQLTMAQVQAAIEEQDWIHLMYDNGRERWISLERGVSAMVREDGPIVYSIPHEGVQWRYGRRFTPTEYTPSFIWKRKIHRYAIGATAWLATVVWEEDIADGTREAASYDVERHVELVDDRLLFRFDGFHTDALGQRLLVRQLWADPVTRLPVRTRERLQLAMREEQGRKFITAEYTFPSEGPESIYDLGVPDSVPIAKTEQSASSDEVEAILNECRSARNRFPEYFRQVTWPQSIQRHDGEVDVYYWSGRPIERTLGEGQVVTDYSEVNIRSLRYFAYLHDDDLLPTNIEDVMAWTERQTAVSEYLSDDGRGYFFGRSFRDENAESHLRVLRTDKRLPYYEYLWILAYQWSPLQYPDQQLTMIPLSPDTPPGTVGLRKESIEQRQDYYLDPEHDYICVKHVMWKRRDDEWSVSRIYVHTDFIQLPEGQWVATRRMTQDMGNPDRGISGFTSTWRIHITPLAPDEFPPGIFDGEKLLEEAKKLGATIETY